LHDDLGTVLVQKSDAQGAAADFPKRSGCSPILHQRIFISAFGVTRKNLSKGPRNTCKLQYN